VTVEAAGGRRARVIPCLPPFLLDALVPSRDGTSLAVRVGGRTVGRVDPAVPAALGLRAGVTVDEAGWPALQEAMARRGAFDAGVRLLARRARSRFAVQRRLSAAFGEEAAMDAVGRLAPYLDDRAFASAWVDARLRRGPVGRTALLAGLRREGVSGDTAREVVDAAAPEVDMGDLARRAAAQRLARMRGVPPQRVRARLWAFLARRGFADAVIAAALRAILTSPGGADDAPSGDG